MATAYTHTDSNVRKTWFLMTVFLAIIIGLGYFASYIYNSPSILYFAVIFSLFMNVLGYWFSDKIVLKMSGAIEARHDDYPDLYHTVENLSITAGLPMPKVYIVTDPSPNAFATGRDKNHAVVAVTTGLLKLLNKTELEGVVAHELSHIGNRDILLSTVIVVLVGFVSIMARMFLHGRSDRRGGGKGMDILALLGLIFVILSPLFAKLIQLAISRRREFLADASGVLLTRYPEGLASALQKISQQQIPLVHQNDAIAHLYIAEPIKTGFGQKVTGLFSTHPPVEERVKALVGNR